ncbi:MAG: hypothetical protein P1U63_04900 [Coxiellaceae bacterium]|nr:hypothetical protein [Coxiellaceae bacterium]
MSDTKEKKAAKSEGSKDSGTSTINNAMNHAQTAYKKVVNPTTIAIASKVIKTAANQIQSVTQMGIKKFKEMQAAKAANAKAKPVVKKADKETDKETKKAA